MQTLKTRVLEMDFCVEIEQQLAEGSGIGN